MSVSVRSFLHKKSAAILTLLGGCMFHANAVLLTLPFLTLSVIPYSALYCTQTSTSALYRLHITQRPRIARFIANHALQGISMTALPPPTPDSFIYMGTADPETVRAEWFRAACAEWIYWQRQCGVTDRMCSVDDFFKDGDLQTFCNVVSWWPKNTPPQYRVPNLADMITCLRILGDNPNVIEPTFAAALDVRINRVKGWMRTQRMDEDNPNETKEERKKRFNRERQRAWQLRNSEGSDDPELHALIVKAREEAESLSQGKAWLKGEIAAAKGAEQAAIAHARAARAERVSAAEAAVAAQEKRMLDAKAIVDHYKAQRINK